MDLTEKLLDREEVFRGKLLNVFSDAVELPDGSESIREWIAHPGAAAIVPLFDDGTTILLRHYRYPSRKTFLEVPAGKLDAPGEDPEEAAARELVEEAGYAAQTITPLGETYPCVGYSDEVIYLFLAEDLEPASSEQGRDEFVEPVRMRFDEAVVMARRGEILDAKSALALLRAAAVVEDRRQVGSAW